MEDAELLSKIEDMIARFDRDGGLSYRQFAQQVIDLARQCDCGKPAQIVECRDCNHWANMED